MTTLKIACASLLLLSGVMAASCSSDTETEAADRVEVSGLDDTVRFTYDAAESVAFTVASNKTWSIAKNGLDWLTVSQMNGGSKLPATVRLTAEANDDLERSGHLTIYAGALAQTVTVTQEACPVVPTITLGGLADNTIAFEFTDTEPVTFKLYANVDWTADKQNLGWAEVAPLSGARKQEATITVTPTANPGDAREGFVTFRAEGMEPVVVTVRQSRCSSSREPTKIGWRSPIPRKPPPRCTSCATAAGPSPKRTSTGSPYRPQRARHPPNRPK